MNLKKNNYLLSLLCLSFSTSVMSNATKSAYVEVKGIENKTLLKNVNLHLAQLEAVDKNETYAFERYKYLVSKAVDTALRAEGYYNSDFTFTPKTKDSLYLNVKLDKPIRLEQRNVELLGDATQDIDFKKLINSIPKVGTILNHKDYDNFKSDFDTLSHSKGYFDSQWLYHRLEINPLKHIANWQLGYNSGKRYQYGEFIFESDQIHLEYLKNILKIKQNDAYSINDLSTLATDLSSTKWFSSVVIEPEIINQSKLVNLHIKTTPEKRNLVEVGIGYETNVGPHLRLDWRKPWLNKRGHSIETKTYVSKPQQTFEVGYNIPLKENPLNHYYQAAASFEHESLKDIKYTTSLLGFQRFWNSPDDWSYSFGLKARYDSFYQGDNKLKTLLIYPTFSFNRIRSDGKRFPNWGDSQKIIVDYGNQIWGSDVDFYSIRATTTWIRTFDVNHRVYLKGELGYLHSNQFERIPTALRFFAGGDNSIRGFSYKELSPRDKDNNRLTGASRLATLNAEYQYQVYPSWWGAIFYDTGLASHSFNSDDIHSGAGLGVRWASPIGAIKFDVAYPIKQKNNKRDIHFYIGLGSEL